MEIGVYKYKISYGGFPESLLEPSDLIDLGDPFSNEVISLMAFNSNMGLSESLVDLSEISENSKSFLKSDLDFGNCKDFRNLEGSHRLFILVSKEYFLGSSDPSIVERTKTILNRISEFFDLNSIRGGILTRVGGAYGNRKKTMGRYSDNFRSLKKSTRDRIYLVNDDRPSLFSVKDLLVDLSLPYNIPIVFKTLAHYFNSGGLNHSEAMSLCISTWKEGIPIIIHSESSDYDESGFPTSREYSEYLNNRIPTFNNKISVLIMCKKRENALLKYLNEYQSLKPVVIDRNP